ncbi:MAG: transporter ATP-binding protein [Rhodoferax sp.]|nr:transporter ATP-binding protein [Rhodoferax sp.]
MPADIILKTKGLTKAFRGFVAVRNVDLQVRRGSIHALIGPNGAGKTTVFNLLTKFHTPSAGSIAFNGIDITAEKPAQTARRGIVRSFQISAVFAQLSVLENVKIALQRKAGLDYRFWQPVAALKTLDPVAMALLEQVGLADASQLLAGDLPYGRKRTLEIATTLALDPELLLLDEPTQGMGHEDVDRIKDLIKQVSAHRTILMVEHNMKVVADISDTITVLQRGEILAEGPYAQVSVDPAVREAYMGTEEEEHV